MTDSARIADSALENSQAQSVTHGAHISHSGWPMGVGRKLTAR